MRNQKIFVFFLLVLYSFQNDRTEFSPNISLSNQIRRNQCYSENLQSSRTKVIREVEFYVQSCTQQTKTTQHAIHQNRIQLASVSTLWQTVWARVIIVTGLIILIFLVYYSKILIIEKRKRELEKLIFEKNLLNEKLNKEIVANRQVQEELKIAKEAAEKSDKLKSEFLAQISHEIRTPLHIVFNFSSMVRDELEQQNNLSGNLVNYFNGISNAGRRIVRTIDLIVNMSQLQAGLFVPKPRMIDLVQTIVIPLKTEYDLLAANKNLHFHFFIESANTKVFTDEFSVTQILDHLLDNALKFTNEGSIKIVIKRNTKNKLLVEVSDTGVGISNEYLPTLFTIFSQEEHGYNRTFDGNGLGLALVKKYCDLNNIQISVTSIKGEGTQFILEFPS